MIYCNNIGYCVLPTPNLILFACCLVIVGYFSEVSFLPSPQKCKASDVAPYGGCGLGYAHSHTGMMWFDSTFFDIFFPGYTHFLNSTNHLPIAVLFSTMS